jgi:phage tail protein X
MSSTYTTIQGDTWDRIAKRFCGDERRMHTLLAANSAHRNVLIFSAGITLAIPAVDTTRTEALPPWKTSA